MFYRALAGCLMVVAIIFTACKKNENEVGLDIQPATDKLNVVRTDTTTVIAYSQLIDSVKTDETTVSLLGSLLDPIFGRTTANVYTQFRLSTSAFSYGDNPVADSLVLAMEYTTSYGDTNAPLTLRVYEMAGQIHIDSTYHSHRSVPVKPTLLAEKTFVPDFYNDVIIGTDTLAPHLRVNLGLLSQELVTKLLNAPADSMANNTSFLNYFYGLYLTVEPAGSGGQIISFNLASTLSKMTLYYRNDSDDSLSYDYVINSNCARFGQFVHDYALGETSFRNQVIYGDTALGKETCYIQANGGVKTRLFFPHIKKYYEDGKIAVNEARLFLKPLLSDTTLPLARNLVLVASNGKGGFTVLEDQLESASYFGGFYDKKNGGYWFRLTSTIQDLMRSDDPHYGFEIYLSGGAINAERTLIVGTDPADDELKDSRIKLVITYTRLD